MDPYSRAIIALESKQCRYVALGGFAVVMHGSNRFTPDINIAIDFESTNVEKVVECLSAAGFKHATQDPINTLRDPLLRQEYRQKKFYCLGFQDPEAPNFKAEILLEHPIDFNTLYENSVSLKLDEYSVRICCLDDLVQMKRDLARPQDNLDIENLLIIKKLSTLSTDERQKFIATAESDFQKDQRVMLSHFILLPAQDRLNWLINMLEELGQFCIISR
jgi:hypothetical protein